MLGLLLRRKELCVCELMAALNITQSKASRHLRYLANAGLVIDRREGVWVRYRLNEEGDEDIKRAIATVAASMKAEDLQEELKRLDDFAKVKGCGEGRARSLRPALP